MATVSFDNDIKNIFSNYQACMENVVLSDEEGTETLDLSNYKRVKRFHYQIQVAIHGYDYDNNGQLLAGATPLLVKEGVDKGKPVVAPHPMPRGGAGSRLDQEDIDKYDKWVQEGMPETAA